MRNCILILNLFISVIVFSQTLDMNVDFNQVNTNFINEKLIEKIKEQRKLFATSEIIQDIVPMASAKYHTDYYKTYGDTSTIHKDGNHIMVDYKGRKIFTEFAEPENRLYSLLPYCITEPYKEDFDIELISEISFFEVFSEDVSITYEKLIDKIFDMFTDFNNKKIIILDYNSGERYFGISSVTKYENNQVGFMLTFVLCTRNYN